jgi:outer membrane biosynthesis protein TonB
MIMKNSLVTLALLASVMACGSDKKNKRTHPAAPTVNTTDVTEETGTPSTDKAPETEEKEAVEPAPVEPTPVEPAVEPTPEEPAIEPTPVEPTPVEPTPVEPTPVEPTPVEPTPVEPAPVEPTPEEPAKTLDIVGTWASCTPYGKGSAIGTSLTFDTEGSLEISSQQFKDKECKEPALKKGAAAPVKATYKVGEELSSQAVALDITDAAGNTVYVAYKIDQDQLTITQSCKQKSKAKGCAGDSAENRAVDFDNAPVTVLNRK